MKLLMWLPMVAYILLSATANAHTMSPGQINDKVYTEVNTYEFTVANRNTYSTSFELLVYDAEVIDGSLVKDPNFRVLGEIQELDYNEAFQFRVDLRAAESTVTSKVICTRMKREVGYRSEVCSLVQMDRY